MILGIDFGTSAVKIALLHENKLLYTKRLELNKYPEEKVKEAVKEIVEGITAEETAEETKEETTEETKDTAIITRIMVTGTGAEGFAEELEDMQIPVEKVDEFEAVTMGGRFLSGKDRCIVCSVGTGTSFSYADGAECQHAGGSGMGGGLLASLAGNMCGYSDMEAFLKLALKGDISKADLKIKDISKEKYGNLYDYVTVANMAKIGESTFPEDKAASICNLVFENIGVMAYLADGKFGSGNVVMLGMACSSDIAGICFKNVADLFGIDIIVPKYAAYGTAIGAALLGDIGSQSRHFDLAG